MSAALDAPHGLVGKDGLAAFLSVRSRLFGIAYRMLGNVMEAEDVVQDVWLRWQSTDRRSVRNATAFLVTTASRLAINVLQSARARHESPAGSWLREPAESNGDPVSETERRQALASGLLLLLETLTPTERAAYILREAFDYPYRRIASVLSVQEANARQLVTRARRRVAGRRRTPASPMEQQDLLEAFTAAALGDDAARLEIVLAARIVESRTIPQCLVPAHPRSRDGAPSLAAV